MIQCPECKTSYQPERLGVKPGTVQIDITTRCLVCGRVFEAQIVPVITEPSRWTPWKSQTVSHTVTTRTRPE